MISLKKSYARQLLQLALTLSLLRVDPDTYFGYGWESQLALQNGDGWQLELRAAPITDYPYSNRKAIIPLIEDLIRFDRRATNPSSYDVQTYLLNVQNEQNSAAATTAAASAPTATTASAAPSPTSNETSNTVTTMSTATQGHTRNMTDFTVPITSDLADLFLLGPEPFGDTLSVLDQNLADLNDYEDTSAANEALIGLNQLYSGLPLKDEIPDLFANHNLRFADSDDEQMVSNVASAASTSSDNNGSLDQNASYGMMRNVESPTMNLSRVIEWSNYYENLTKPEIKSEDAEDEGVVAEETNSTSSSGGPSESVRIKSESEGDDDDRASSSDGKNSTSGFSSNVELTEEVNSNFQKIFFYNLV